MKVYAVRKGRRTGLFETWEECREQVSGYSGAEYKSFQSYEDAEDYLSPQDNSAPSGVKAYVDGSYDHASRAFSCGLVIIHPNGKIEKFSRKSADQSMASMRNVAGEIMGAMMAMDYAIRGGLCSITIYYDYAGIEKWCTGEWQVNRPGTIKYRSYYDSIKNKTHVSFVKVKGHSGDKYNDLADLLAKEALFSKG